VGLIVDTCEFIALERTGGSPGDIIDFFGTSELYAVSVMTLAELRHGVQRANSDQRREQRQRFLDDVISDFPIYSMDERIALRLGELDAWMQMNGKKRDLPDLIIAATALELDFAVATQNRKHFEDISGLRLAKPLPAP